MTLEQNEFNKIRLIIWNKVNVLLGPTLISQKIFKAHFQKFQWNWNMKLRTLSIFVVSLHSTAYGNKLVALLYELILWGLRHDWFAARWS